MTSKVGLDQMNYDLKTVDYIYDCHSYTIFLMQRCPLSLPMEQWQENLHKFPFSLEKFREWNRAQWTLKEDELETFSQSETTYRWTWSVDFYRGFPERLKMIEIEGLYPDDLQSIHFSSQSLFLFDFISRMTLRFRVSCRIFVSVGTDLDIVEFKENQDLQEFLRKIHGHYNRIDRD